eukprot:TRINITY_DN35699_c0_g1_i1.p1 TRINITY_DN35699_c0_g1~~TRINITY_DN35699_c0_g1_i1.p1  ORF type:complete len:101 (+),score=9.93 TRINITY_DN35699_c0_g1_i1:256-558(+)
MVGHWCGSAKIELQGGEGDPDLAQREDSVYAKKKIRTYNHWCTITRAEEDNDLCQLSCPKKKEKSRILVCKMKERFQWALSSIGHFNNQMGAFAQSTQNE